MDAPGPNAIKALQRKFGAGDDGKVSNPTAVSTSRTGSVLNWTVDGSNSTARGLATR